MADEKTADKAAPEVAETTETTEVTETTEAPETDGASEEKAPVETAEADATPADWRDAIPDDNKDLRKYAERHPSAVDMAQDAFDLRKKLSTAVVPPGKDATDEDVATFNKAIGVPESADGYNLKFGEGDLGGEQGEALLQEFLEAQHKAHATPAAAQSALDSFLVFSKRAIEAQEAGHKAHREETDTALRHEWAGDYEPNMQHARNGMTYLGEEVKIMFDAIEIDGVKASDHPAVVKGMAKVGRNLANPEPLMAMTTDQRTDLQSRLATLTADEDVAMQRGNMAEAQRINREIMSVSEAISGAGTIVGSQGRLA